MVTCKHSIPINHTQGHTELIKVITIGSCNNFPICITCILSCNHTPYGLKTIGVLIIRHTSLHNYILIRKIYFEQENCHRNISGADIGNICFLYSH
ncbi:hypothetical protein D3C86_1119910 [compost metagenome]